MATAEDRFSRPTPRQAEALAAIERFQLDNGFAATLADLAKVLGISNSAVVGLVAALRRKGMVTSRPGIARSLRSLHAVRPDAAAG